MKTTSKAGFCATALLVTVGCLPVQNRRPIETPRTTSDGALRPTAPQPIDDARLTSFGIEVFWNSWLRDEVITKLQLEANTAPLGGGAGKGNLYAFTASYRLYQIDLASGKVNWVFEVGAPLAFADRERPICEFNYPPDDTLKRYDEVFLVSKDTLYALDKADGSELWRYRCKFSVASPPQATVTHVILGAWDERVYAIQKTDPTTYDWMYRTNAEVRARPAVAQQSPQCYVASMDGSIYTFQTNNGDLTQTLKTEKPISADPLVYENALYVGGEDYNLYVWSSLTGFPYFRYECGGPVKTAPVAMKNPIEKGKNTSTIYVKTEGTAPGIIAILRGNKLANSEKIVHEFLWKRDGAQQVLARGRDTVFLLEPAGKDAPVNTKKIVKVDVKSCYVRDEATVTGIDYFITNPLDPNDKRTIGGGLMICGYRNGWLLAYKEKSPYPAE